MTDPMIDPTGAVRRIAERYVSRNGLVPPPNVDQVLVLARAYLALLATPVAAPREEAPLPITQEQVRELSLMVEALPPSREATDLSLALSSLGTWIETGRQYPRLAATPPASREPEGEPVACQCFAPDVCLVCGVEETVLTPHQTLCLKCVDARTTPPAAREPEVNYHADAWGVYDEDGGFVTAKPTLADAEDACRPRANPHLLDMWQIRALYTRPPQGVTEAMAKEAALESARVQGAVYSPDDVEENWDSLRDEWIQIVTAALRASAGGGNA